MATQQENKDKLTTAIEAQKKAQEEARRLGRALRGGAAESEGL